MVDIGYNIFEEDFNKDQIHTYNLSVLLGADRLYYLVTNAEHKVLGLRTYTFGETLNPITTILKEDNILNANYQQIKIGVFANQITLVPVALYLEEEAQTYLEATTELKRNDIVLADSIGEIKGIFSYDEEALNALLSAFPKATVSHVSSGLIQNFKSNFDSTTQNIFANIYANSVSITVVDKGALIFHNIFSFKTSTDCLYYILLVYKQLNINPQKIPLYVAGEFVEEAEIYQALFKYIKTLKFVTHPNFYTFGKAIKKALPANLFFDLYSLKLCE